MIKYICDNCNKELEKCDLGLERWDNKKHLCKECNERYKEKKDAIEEVSKTLLQKLREKFKITDEE